MEKPIIEVKNIGKKYNIIHQKGGYVSLRDVMMNTLKSPFSFLKNKAKRLAGFETKEDFWALKDINFAVNKGEIIGIIGRNGAGKSTLLKILSQITPPTTGEIRIHGKIGSLLEVGTGFHPELSGRENIFLNGAILGMTKKEITEKFSKIVEFAGIEKFLDTPVKHYSSGMYVRLAFSVAAHMEPDILIIDEVLAVGDAEFQKKCLGKMEEVTQKDKRTILFVSHNMGAIQSLCQRCIWLDKGEIKKIGETKNIINDYLNSSKTSETNGELKDKQLSIAQYKTIKIINKKNSEQSCLPDNEPITVLCEFEIREKVPDIYFGMVLKNSDGTNILFADSRDNKANFPSTFPVGLHKISLTIPPYLAPGKYFLSLGISLINTYNLDTRENACYLEIIDSKGFRSIERPGILNFNIPWKQEK